MKTLTALLLISAAYAQNPGHTLNGWGPITWGMTVAEARAALPEATPSTEIPGPAFTFIERLTAPVTVGAIAGRASIQSARGASTITSVTLTMADVQHTPAQRTAVYTELKSMLLQKYAAPRDEQTRPNGTGSIHRTVNWNFDTTSITLLWSEGSGRGNVFGYVTIQYRALDRTALDVL